MSQRVTRSDVVSRANYVSNALRDGLHIVPQGRNGYTALDLYDGSGCVRLLTAGTKSECYAYLGAMLDTLQLLGR